jgi:aquaporin Z
VLGDTFSTSPFYHRAIAIGLALTAVHLVGIPVTGTSVNPARSLGPALVVGGSALSQVWLFMVAPLIGGPLAAGLHRLLYRQEDITLAAEASRPGRPRCPLTNADHCCGNRWSGPAHLRRMILRTGPT